MGRPENVGDFLIERIKRWCVIPREEKIEYNRILFSGRFDPVHPAHWVTILRLLKIASQVIVVVLDYPGRKYYAGYSAQLFEESVQLSGLSDKIEVWINEVHFAEITADALDRFDCDSYAAAANLEVLSHVWALGKPCVYMDRAYDYEASAIIPKWKQGGESMKRS